MQLKEFLVETWLNPRCPVSKYNLGSSGVQSIAIDELFELAGEDLDAFMKEVRHMNMHYGYFFGSPRLKNAISKLYRKQDPELILTVHGGTGANHMVLAEYSDPTTNVVSIVPNYQQHYSIPEALGAEVRYVRLKADNNYLPDIKEIAQAVDSKTSIIALSNPNNPTGSAIKGDMLQQICDIAEKVGAIVLSDEIYRGLHEDYLPSVVDLYHRGVTTNSMSKVLSMAGTRVGWIATNDHEIYKRLETRRSYDTICGGIFDELLAAIAIENADKIYSRNREIVKKHQKIVQEWLDKQPHLHGTVMDGSPIAFLNYDYDLTSTEFGEALFEKTGTVVCHGDCFDMPRAFRLGFGYIETSILKEALQVLGDFMATLPVKK